MGFQELIRLLNDGVDKVDAGTLNTILRAICDNVSYLRDLLNASGNGSAIFARDVVVKSDVLVGQPVYWNPTNGRYEKAIAASELNDDNDLVLAQTAQVWGIVYSKSSATVADLVLAGHVQIDLDNAITGDPEETVYYLDGTTPGKLTADIPAVVVSVLQYMDGGYVNVRPSFKDALDTFNSADTVVTDLISLSDKLVITCQTDDTSASKGPLQIDLDLNYAIDSSSEDGALVIKSFDGESVLKGPVVESIRAGSNISLSATLESGLDHQGTVTITADLELGGKELVLEQIRLDNTTEEYYEGIPAIGFEDGRTSSIRGKIYIPTDVPEGYTAKFRFRLLGRTVGAFPDFNLSYRRIPRNSAVLTDKLPLPTSDTTLTFSTSVTLTSGQEDYYVEAESDDFEIEAGDVVWFTLERESAATGPDVWMLDGRGILISN